MNPANSLFPPYLLPSAFNTRYHQHLNHLNDMAFNHTKILQEMIEKRSVEPMASSPHGSISSSSSSSTTTTTLDSIQQRKRAFASLETMKDEAQANKRSRKQSKPQQVRPDDEEQSVSSDDDEEPGGVNVDEEEAREKQVCSADRRFPLHWMFSRRRRFHRRTSRWWTICKILLAPITCLLRCSWASSSKTCKKNSSRTQRWKRNVCPHHCRPHRSSLKLYIITTIPISLKFFWIIPLSTISPRDLRWLVFHIHRQRPCSLTITTAPIPFISPRRKNDERKWVNSLRSPRLFLCSAIGDWYASLASNHHEVVSATTDVDLRRSHRWRTEFVQSLVGSTERRTDGQINRLQWLSNKWFSLLVPGRERKISLITCCNWVLDAHSCNSLSLRTAPFISVGKKRTWRS